MCGIYFSCGHDHLLSPSIALQALLRKRGPDYCKIVARTIHRPAVSHALPEAAEQPPLYLKFFSTVLSLRGDAIIGQPLTDPASQSILCWNGEAWGIDSNPVVGNDAVAVLELLTECANLVNRDSSAREAHGKSVKCMVVDAISRITGPYAFVYYDASSRQLFYGRDILGRRSLLVNQHQKGLFAISSICDPENPEGWVEVEPNVIHVLDLITVQETLDLGTKEGGTSNFSTSAALNHQLSPLNRTEPSTTPLALTQSSLVVRDLENQLNSALKTRVENVPSIPGEQVTLPRLAILFSGGLDCSLLARLVHDIVPFDQAIDLLNVAFENPRIVRAAKGHNEATVSPLTPYALCPDRITGISSHTELMKVCPERIWRFVCIDVPYLEMKEHRALIISLIQPHNTEMDLSIASALYFAARGSGVMMDDISRRTEPYATPARVLLSGLGADEIFAGYQRHATAFLRRGYSALIEELEIDINRLGKRNLGRDDRVISNWGKEARYPYLDESMVNWALSLPVWEKCGFGAHSNTENKSAQELEPGKSLLRLLAWKRGLCGVAVEKKRAIQFGARTAKMEIGNVKGTQAIT